MNDILYKDYKKYADFYDIFNKHRYYNIESKYLLEMLQTRRRVLDVGCGTGTHFNILENLGYIVEGIDINPKMIAVARTKVKGNIYEADLLTYKTEEVYDAIIAMKDVFNHLSSYEEFEKGILNLLNLLKSKGMIIIDIDNRRQTGIKKDNIDGVRRIQECKYDSDTEIQTRKITYYIGTKKFETIHKYLIYNPKKLKKILDKMNISYVFLTNYSKQKFSNRQKRMQILIKKL